MSNVFKGYIDAVARTTYVSKRNVLASAFSVHFRSRINWFELQGRPEYLVDASRALRVFAALFDG